MQHETKEKFHDILKKKKRCVLYVVCFMKIIVSQQDKKLNIEFYRGKVVDRYAIDKAEDFLGVVDRFIKKRKIDLVSLRKADLKFENTGILTERVIRAIMLGLCFDNE